MCCLGEPLQPMRLTPGRPWTRARVRRPSGDGRGAQVCGAAQLPVPSARYSMGADRTVVSVGEGAFHLHVAQVNAVLHL
jgi:hypothetical protein